MPKATYKGLGSPSLDVEFLSTASTALTLTQDQQSKLLVWGGQAAAARIRLPAPEAGMEYFILFNDAAVSSATKITSSGVYDIVCGNTTAKVVILGSTAELGGGHHLVAINSYRWFADRFGNSTMNSTNGTT